MRLHTVVLCCLLLVGVGAAVAVGGAAATPASDGNATENGSADEADQNGPGLGAELSAFVSSTGAATEGTVEREMSSAALNRSADPRAVENRVTTLTTRYERLRADQRALKLARENGTVSPVEYRARRAALAAQAESLGDSVAAVAPTARRYGVANESLNALQRRLPTDRATWAGPAGNAGPPNGTLPPLGPPNGTPAAGPPNGTPANGPPNASDSSESPGAGNDSAGRANGTGGGPPDTRSRNGASGANGTPAGNEGSPGSGGEPGKGNQGGNGAGNASDNAGGNGDGSANGGNGTERGSGRRGGGPAANGSRVAAGRFASSLSLAHGWAVELLG